MSVRTDATFIRLQPAAPQLDYVWLKARGQQIIQQLAGAVWTDYNEHDPGVTTLEQLCYALTELSYRARLPVEDLLTAPGAGGIDPRRQALMMPRAILPCSPLTERDVCKLIVDRVPAVGNAWLTPARSRHDAPHGLYDVELYLPRLQAGGVDSPQDTPAAGSTPPRLAAVRRRVRRTFVRHRSLCEDIHRIHVLRPVRAALRATVTIDGSSEPEAVLAWLFYRAGCVLAPEPRRQTLHERLDRGETPASVFTGPPLRHGFISDDELGERPTVFTVGEIARVLAATTGVTGVQQVSLAIDGAAAETGGLSSLAVPRRSILQLDTRAAGGRFSIRLLRGGVEYRPEPRLVARELDRLWLEHRRRHDIRAETDRLLALPAGRSVELGAYTSIQEQFPAVYGINAYGVGAEATDERRARARQFKGYLLVFEQLLADAFARLDGLRDLGSVERGPVVSRAFHQYLDTCVPDVEPLLASTYRTDLATIGETRERRLERRNRFLDFMLAGYGEVLEPVVTASAAHQPVRATGCAREVRTKLRFLRHLSRIGRNRGKGCDYLAPLSPRNVAGLEMKTRLQLGMDLVTTGPLTDLIGRLGVELIDAPPAADYEAMTRHAKHIEAHFAPVETVASGRWASVPGSAPQKRHRTERMTRQMTEEQLLAMSRLEHYRIGALPGSADLCLVCRAPSQPIWQFVGRYPDRAGALADVRVLLRLAGTLRQQARRLYVVEHVLLRDGRGPDQPGEDPDFDEGLTATTVACFPAREANDAGYRQHVRQVIRANTPAHIVMGVCFLRLRHVPEFETLHAEWRRALRDRDRGLAESCRRLREFLRPVRT